MQRNIILSKCVYTNLEAVKMQDLLVTIALIEALWAFTSPNCCVVSTDQSFKNPWRQPLNKTLLFEKKLRAQIQSLCAWLRDYKEKENIHWYIK